MGDGEAQVEQCRAARDVHRPPAWIAVAQGSRRVRIDLDDPVVSPDHEPPRLAVMHRRRHGRDLDQPLGCPAGQRVFRHQSPRAWPHSRCGVGEVIVRH
jgi:hypothetical protein